MLCTIFRWEDITKPIQIVLKKYEIEFEEYDFYDSDKESVWKLVSDLKESDRNKRIDNGCKKGTKIFVKNFGKTI